MMKNKQSNGKFWALFAVLFAALVLMMLAAVCMGKYGVTPVECLKIVIAAIFGKESGLPVMTENVVLGLRLPRIAASVLVGAALSVSGAAYQGIFKNPLISPDFLGVSSGSCVGAAAAILLSFSTRGVSLFAFLGGLAAVLLTTLIPTLIGNRSNIMLVLSGVIVGALMSSLLGFIKYIADPMTQLASITYWTMGSFSYITLEELGLLLPVVLVPTVVLVLISWWIDVLSMGEEDARILGANVRLVRGICIVCATLLTAGSVCISGSIGWVGLIVPHFCRMLVGPVNRKLVPLSAVAGGLFLLLVDTLTRSIGVEEMPVSILTGIIGAPVYCWLLFRQRRNAA